MKQLKIIAFLILTVFLSACSFSYNIVIINDSNDPIEVHYKITESSRFNEPMIKSVKDWNTQKSIERFWTKEVPWRNLRENEYETNLGVRIIRIPSKQIVQIENGNYNPISEKEGDLTKITELKIISPFGEIYYKGKLLLNQFEKEGYTFVKNYKDELTREN